MKRNLAVFWLSLALSAQASAEVIDGWAVIYGRDAFDGKVVTSARVTGSVTTFKQIGLLAYCRSGKVALAFGASMPSFGQVAPVFIRSGDKTFEASATVEAVEPFGGQAILTAAALDAVNHAIANNLQSIALKSSDDTATLDMAGAKAALDAVGASCTP